MSPEYLTAIISAISALVSAMGAGITAFIVIRKIGPEVKKIEAEEDSEIADAAHTTLEGARISSTMLIDRIDDLKLQLENERTARKADAEYFRRRIRELERESRDYRLWAAKLVRQVVEAGRQPAPFESTITDSDPLLSVITKEQIDTSKANKKG